MTRSRPLALKRSVDHFAAVTRLAGPAPADAGCLRTAGIPLGCGSTRSGSNSRPFGGRLSLRRPAGPGSLRPSRLRRPVHLPPARELPSPRTCRTLPSPARLPGMFSDSARTRLAPFGVPFVVTAQVVTSSSVSSASAAFRVTVLAVQHKSMQHLSHLGCNVCVGCQTPSGGRSYGPGHRAGFLKN